MREHLRAGELAKTLSVSTAAVRRWTREGMPCARLGKRLVRFHEESALAWLRQRSEEKPRRDS